MRSWLRKTGYAVALFCFYISCTLQWLWLSVLVLPALIKDEYFSSLLQPPQSSTPPLSQNFTLPEPIAVGLAGIVTILVLAVTAIVLWRLPKTVNREATKAVEKTTEKLLPVVTHRAKLKPKEAKRLRVRISLGLQIGIVTVPFIATLLLPSLTELEPRIVALVAGFLFSSSLLLLAVSYGLRPKKRVTSQIRSRASRGSH